MKSTSQFLKTTVRIGLRLLLCLAKEAHDAHYFCVLRLTSRRRRAAMGPKRANLTNISRLCLLISPLISIGL